MSWVPIEEQFSILNIFCFSLIDIFVVQLIDPFINKLFVDKTKKRWTIQKLHTSTRKPRCFLFFFTIHQQIFQTFQCSTESYVLKKIFYSSSSTVMDQKLSFCFLIFWIMLSFSYTEHCRRSFPDKESFCYYDYEK